MEHAMTLPQAIADDRRAWLVTAMLCLSTVINFIDKGVIGLAAVPIMHEFQLSPAQYGFIASSFFLLYALSGVLVGLFVVQRVTSKWLMAGLVLGWSLVQIPIGFTSSVAIIVVCRILLGVFEGPGSPAAFHTCMEWFPSERRNVPMAVVMMGAGIGTFIGAPLLTWFIITTGWRSAFLVCSAIGFAWLLGWLLIGGQGAYAAPRRHAGQPRGMAGRLPAAKFWLDGTILGAIIVGFCAYWVTGFVVAWLAPYLRLGLGYDARTTGWLMSLISASGSVALFAVSFLSQAMLKSAIPSRIARGAVNSGCLLLGGAAVCVAIFLGPGAIKLVLLGIGLGLPMATFTLGPAIVGEVAPTPQRGMAVVVIFSGVSIAGIFSPLAAGKLISLAGPQAAATGFDHALLLVTGILLFGGVAGLALLRPERTKARFAALVSNPPGS